jgi:nucleoside-diphosphate-sugar epimerase
MCAHKLEGENVLVTGGAVFIGSALVCYSTEASTPPTP